MCVAGWAMNREVTPSNAVVKLSLASYVFFLLPRGQATPCNHPANRNSPPATIAEPEIHGCPSIPHLANRFPRG
jgi:hypothetical protein